MNDELATQTTTTPIVLKLKKLDDHHPNVILPHSSHLSAENLDDPNLISSSLLRNDETSTNISNHGSPTSLRVKLKTSFLNGTTDNIEDEFSNPSLTDLLSRPAKRCKTSLSDEFTNQTTSVIGVMNDSMISSQEDTEKLIHEIAQDYEPSIDSPPLVIKIRRDSSTTNNLQTNPTSGIPSSCESESNRQLLIKIKKNEHGDIVNNHTSMSTDYLLAEQNCANNNELLSNKTDLLHSNGYHEQIYESTPKEISTGSPSIVKMLVGVDEKIPTSSISTINNYVTQEPQASTASSSSQIVEGHTKELLDEALDSVKNVLMQTIKKNLESGGDLNSLKTTLGSDEVAEVFLAKLRQSLKRETASIVENIESKSIETTMESETTTRCETPNPTMSPITNVVSSPSSSSPLLPPLSTMISKTTSPSPSSSTTLPSSPQPQTPSNTNSKRKVSTPSTNPNRSDCASEEELAKRLLSDILQPNLDIVFVGINPSLYAVHKGHHYGGPGNHFWKLLHMCGLIPTPFTATDDHKMPQYGIGFTNIVQRPAKAGSDITKDEITAGAEVLLQKIKMFRPKIIVFNGRGIYEVYAGSKHFHYGKQPEPFPGSDAHVFVMPSSSARCSQLPRAEDKLPFFVGLKKLRDFVTGNLPSLNESEITFPDIKIKDTDDVLQKTTIRINNKPFSELSPDLLKTFGDKYPSAQLALKNSSAPTTQTTICSSPSPSSSSSPSLVFNTEALTTQTMSILHNSFLEQNDNLITHDQQPQRVYLQNDGQYSPSPPPSHFSNNSSTSITMQPQRLSTNGIGSMKSSFLETNSPSSTNAAVLAALASSSNTSSPNFYQPTQTVYLGGVGGQQSQQQSQQVSFSTSSINNGTTILTVRPSTLSTSNTAGTMIHSSNFNKTTGSSTSSHVIHHYPNSTSSNDSSNQSIHLSSSSALSRPVVVVNSSESLPSFESILHPSTSNSSTYSSTMRTSTAVIVPTVISNSTPSLSSLLASSSSITSSSVGTSAVQSLSLTTAPMTATSATTTPSIAATNSAKDFISSQLSTNKSTLILVPPTIKQINSNASNIIIPKLSNASKVTNSFSAEKRTNDDCLFIRYERESTTSNTEQYRFSFVIDECPTSTQKRSRYVSINDL